ncbi:MAG: flavodoxin family protein [Acidimicrobiales bacterium]
MRAVVIYESMYGNTHLIADAVAEGLRPQAEVVVVPVGRAEPSLLDSADLIVVGGPTHAHGMSHANTRKGAVAAAEKADSDGLALEADATGQGLREWFASLGRVAKDAAAFDTRFDFPAAFTGQASKGIARKLRHHGATLIAEPQSFFVTKGNRLEPNEESRARDWGARLGSALAATGAGRDVAG